MGNVYAYVRVSSKDQNEDRQLDALKEFNIPEKNIFIEKMSGKDFNRQISEARKKVEEGRYLVFQKYR